MFFYELIWDYYATFPYCILGMLLWLEIGLKYLELLEFIFRYVIKSIYEINSSHT